MYTLDGCCTTRIETPEENIVLQLWRPEQCPCNSKKPYPAHCTLPKIPGNLTRELVAELKIDWNVSRFLNSDSPFLAHHTTALQRQPASSRPTIDCSPIRSQLVRQPLYLVQFHPAHASQPSTRLLPSHRLRSFISVETQQHQRRLQAQHCGRG